MKKIFSLVALSVSIFSLYASENDKDFLQKKAIAFSDNSPAKSPGEFIARIPNDATTEELSEDLSLSNEVIGFLRYGGVDLMNCAEMACEISECNHRNCAEIACEKSGCHHRNLLGEFQRTDKRCYNPEDHCRHQGCHYAPVAPRLHFPVHLLLSLKSKKRRCVIL